MVATVVKFGQDRSARLAAGIAFWAFFAVFPLLLVLVSLLGFFLPDSTRSEVMHNVAALFPLIDPDNVRRAHGEHLEHRRGDRHCVVERHPADAKRRVRLQLGMGDSRGRAAENR